MIQSLIHRFLKRRHFWRYASFNEVAELYTARFLRQTAGFLISMFVVVYMYREGYSLSQISLFYIWYFSFKAFVAYFAALYAARFGPKHGMLMANILSIPALMAFSLLTEYDWLALIIFSIFQSTSITLYQQSHLIDFSKVKHLKNAGKEISFMNIIDKITASLSPLIGGIVAWQLGPQVTVWLAVILYSIAALPLLRTAEPVITRQKISFQAFPWKNAWRSMVASVAVGVDAATSVVVWPLFLAAILFAGSGDDVYAKIGGLASITLIVSFLASRTYGVLIDQSKGRQLLQYAAIGNALTHLSRVFVATPFSAALVNVINEVATTGTMMSFTRGVFDLADRTGHRIAYLYLVELMHCIGLILLFVLLFVFLLFFDDHVSFALIFVVTGFLTLGIASARFPLYRK
jgi:MFS family permease